MGKPNWKAVKISCLLVISGVTSFVMWNSGAVALLLLLFVINLVTAYSSEWTAEKMTGSAYTGIAGSLLYTWAPYRLYSIRMNEDYYEMTVWALLPLLAYGGYQLFKKGYDWRKKTALWAGIPGVGILLINGKLWVRDGIRLLGGSYVLEEAFSLQEHGVYPVHYLMTYFQMGNSQEFGETGMVDSAPIGIGFLVTLGVLGYLWLHFTDKISPETREEEKNHLAFTNTMLLIGAVVMILSTNAFPWDDLRIRYKLYTAAVIFIQKPSRLMGITMLCFWTVSCMVISLYRHCKSAPDMRSGD